MDRESVERLRHDIRLKRRREWNSPEEREAHLNSLPDLTDKMIRGSEEEEEEAASSVSAPASTPTAGEIPASSFAPLSSPAAEETPATPIPFGSSASPSTTFTNDPSNPGGDGGSSTS